VRGPTQPQGARSTRRLIIIAGLLFTTTALAIDPGLEGLKGQGGYGAAGCGQGETIGALSSMAGCASSRAVGAALQQRHATIIPSEQALGLTLYLFNSP
jgi:hypothetical protein